MNKSLPALLVIVGALASPSAFAQTAPVQPWQPPPAWGPAPPPSVAGPPMYLAPPRAADWPRFRFGVASNFTIGAASDFARGVNAVVLAPGATVDLGVQLSRSLAVFARASGATLILVNQAALFATVEYTPVDWLSLGTGLGWMAVSSPLTELSTSSAFSAPAPSRGSWDGIAMPAIVAFNLGERDPVSERLGAFRIGLEGVFGVEPGTGIIGWSASISLGFVRM